MTEKFISKLRLIASKRGYELYWPSVMGSDGDTGIGLAKPDQRDFAVLLDTALLNSNELEAIIKALPKVRENA